MGVKPELAFDVCWEVYRGAREVLETKRGVSALNWKDTGKYLWRPDFRPRLNEWVADFALAGQAALDGPDWASRMVMFRLYYLGLAPYETARHFLGLSEHSWVNWSEQNSVVLAAKAQVSVSSRDSMDGNRPAPSTIGSLTLWGRTLLAFLFLNGLGGVVGGIAVMKEFLPFPEVWLKGTPFHSYFLPGLILCVAVGGSHLAAAAAVLSRSTLVRTASVFAGFVLTGWMIGEIKLIGLQAPIQVWFVGVGLIEIGLSFTKLRRSLS